MRIAMLTVILAGGMAPRAAEAARSEPVSWGRTGISIEQYRRDAVECGRAGHYLDVSGTDGAKVLKNASRQLENNETNLQTASRMMAAQPSPEQAAAAMNNLYSITGHSARIVEQARAGEQVKPVGAIMRAEVDACLLRRGYSRFRLTLAQRKTLRRLHLGSPERHAYLFCLATDPNVLATQAY